MADQSIPRLLLESARQDEKAVAALSSIPDIGDAIIGFHAQQAVEKAIKAVLSSAVIFPQHPRHCRAAGHSYGLRPAATTQRETLDELNPYAVEARYGLIAISGLDRQKVGMTIGQVLAWAEMRID